MPKRVNPRSLENLRPGSASKGGKIVKNLNLLPNTIEMAEAIGRHGAKPSCSDGIDRVFEALPSVVEVLELCATLPDLSPELRERISGLLRGLR